MTFEERVRLVEPFGFTPKQARFVVTVSLHGGYCLRRQYAAFAGVRYGKNVRGFLDELVARGFARRFIYRAHRGYLYHLHAKAIYRAIEQEDNRNRRHASPALVARKLMLLDFVLSRPDVEWYATERDKVQLFTRRFGVPLADLPGRVFAFGGQPGRSTTRHFLDKLPIYVEGLPGIVHFVYLVTDPSGHGLEGFLRDHGRLMARLPACRVVAVCPPHINGLPRCTTVFEQFVRYQRAEPAVLARDEDLRWYCRMRAAVEREEYASLSVEDLNRFRQLTNGASRAHPRLERLYAEWLEHGDDAFEKTAVPGADAAANEMSWTLVPHVLPHTYERFGALPGVV